MNWIGGKSVRTKKQLAVFASLLILIALLMNLHFMGCTGTASKKELTPEQQKAIQDSIARVHKAKVARLFSFGWEPFKQAQKSQEEGQTFEAQQSYEKAKKYFRQVANIDSTGIYGKILYQSLGACFLNLGVPDSAEWAYMQGIKNVPKDSYGYQSLIYIYKQQGRNDEGLDISDAYITNVPDDPKAFASKGEFLVRLDMVDDAIDAYQKAIELDPENATYREILNTIAADDIDLIIENAESLVTQNPDNMKYRQDLAEAYHQAAMFEKAIEQLTIVIENQTDNTIALELLGDSYQQIEQYRSASNIFKKILAISPDDKKNICNLSICYTYLGNYVTARREANKALRIDSKYGLAFIARGMVYEIAADRVVEKHEDQQTKYDDKLVYKLAYDEYQKAKQDLQWKSEAERRLSYVQTQIPTKEDSFMYQNRTTPESEAYNWIY
jgi:tetratricopeptide (TPR) repeat protein